jgi:hypothetical protein
MPNTREKLIELITDKENDLIRKIAWFTDTYRIKEVADHLIANGVTLDNQVSSSKWISVKERLPKHLEFILCYLVYDEICVCQWDTFNETWIANTWDYSKDAVSHWMPLPQPPKGE